MKGIASLPRVWSGCPPRTWAVAGGAVVLTVTILAEWVKEKGEAARPHSSVRFKVLHLSIWMMAGHSAGGKQLTMGDNRRTFFPPFYLTSGNAVTEASSHSKF